MPNILPFRQVNEYDKINLYMVSGATLPVSKGTFVYISRGWTTEQEINELGNVGAGYTDTVSLRYGVQAAVTPVNATGVASLGILLNDVREVDENGEKLIFKPRKAAEMQAVLSGQACPIAVRGMFLYSGIAGTPTAGSPAFSTGDGGLSTTASDGLTTGYAADLELVGKFLGTKNTAGHALVFIDL